jgi:hypothetical protein
MVRGNYLSVRVPFSAPHDAFFSFSFRENWRSEMISQWRESAVKIPVLLAAHSTTIRLRMGLTVPLVLR